MTEEWLWPQEKMILYQMLKNARGEFLLQIGGPNQSHEIDGLGWFKTKVRLCQENYTEPSAPVIQSDLDRLPIESDSIDVILLIHCLEKKINREAMLAEIFRVLKSSGQLIIVCFNAVGVGRFYRFSQDFFSIRKTEKLLQKNDFRISTIKTIGFRPPIKNKNIADRLLFLETFGQFFFSNFGSVFIISAYKKISGMTLLPAYQHKKKIKLQTQLTESPITRTYFYE